MLFKQIFILISKENFHSLFCWQFVALLAVILMSLPAHAIAQELDSASIQSVSIQMDDEEEHEDEEGEPQDDEGEPGEQDGDDSSTGNNDDNSNSGGSDSGNADSGGNDSGNSGDQGGSNEDDQDSGNNEDQNDTSDKKAKKLRSKGLFDLSDDQLKSVESEDGEVTCGNINGRWLGGKINKKGYFLVFIKAAKALLKKARQGKIDEDRARSKASRYKKQHRSSKELCLNDGSGTGSGDSGSGSGGSGDSGSGGSGSSNYIVYESNPNLSYGANVMTTAYRAYLGGKLVFTVGIGKGNSQAKALHATKVGLEYLDNNEDGTCDNQTVCDALVARNPLLMFVTDAQLTSLGDPPANAANQPLFPSETHPDSVVNGGTRQVYDFAHEEILHLLTDNGWGRAYPTVFGSSSTSTWGQLVTSAISASLYDPTASGDTQANDFSTTVPESLYWTITSLFGDQGYSWRTSQVSSEWKSYTAALCQTNVPQMVALIQDAQYGFPLTQVNGNYAPVN